MKSASHLLGEVGETISSMLRYAESTYLHILLNGILQQLYAEWTWIESGISLFVLYSRRVG